MALNVAGVGFPLLKPFLGSGEASKYANTAVNDLTAIGQVIVQVETAIQAPGSGAQKLQFIIPLVANIVKTSEMVTGHQIGDDALFVKGTTEIAQGVVDVLNSLKSDNVKGQGQAVLPAKP